MSFISNLFVSLVKATSSTRQSEFNMLLDMIRTEINFLSYNVNLRLFFATVCVVKGDGSEIMINRYHLSKDNFYSRLTPPTFSELSFMISYSLIKSGIRSNLKLLVVLILNEY